MYEFETRLISAAYVLGLWLFVELISTSRCFPTLVSWETRFSRFAVFTSRAMSSSLLTMPTGFPFSTTAARVVRAARTGMAL